MMALDAKAIKEEIPDKDVYDSSARRAKGKDQCRTPDSPESVRAVAPLSPISPHNHHNNNNNTNTNSSSLAPPRSGRNGSSSPLINGSSTPPLASSASTTPHAATPTLLQDPLRALTKVRRFLGALIQFGQDTSVDIGDRVRALILSLASGGLSSDEFKVALQEATNFPVRPYVLPFLKTHIPLLQREIASQARACNQSPMQYVRSNENTVIEFAHSTEHADIFLPIDMPLTNGSTAAINGNGSISKRRASESFFDHSNAPHDWNEYMLPTKRPHLMVGSSSHLFAGSHPPLFDYQSAAAHGAAEPFGALLDKNARDRDERELRPDSQRANSRLGGEEEWKNIHTMLNCISAMVDKTKRAITILQQRGVEQPAVSYQQEVSLNDMKRQTEEKVAEFRRNAEDAVNQVKRQAVIEIQRAVSAAESRAVDAMAQERLKMEKMFAEMSKSNSDESESQAAAAVPGSQNVCWNCGRKANETCSGCNLARYCGAFCQHKDWEQHHQICGNSRVDPNSAKHPPPHFRTAVPPSRTSPSSQQQQQQQQQLQQPPSSNLANGITSAGSK